MDWSNLSFDKSLRGAGMLQAVRIEVGSARPMADTYVAEWSIQTQKLSEEQKRENVKREVMNRTQQAGSRRTTENRYSSRRQYITHAGIRRSKREDKGAVTIRIFLNCRNQRYTFLFPQE